MASHSRLLTSQCSHCEVTRFDLLTCSGCNVVKYCSAEHEALDKPMHKVFCDEVQEARTNRGDKEAAVQKAWPDTGVSPAAFDRNSPFWDGDLAYRFMIGQMRLINALVYIPTQEAVRTALELTMQCLDLNSGFLFGLRESVVPLMLRLGLDQEAYDYMNYILYQAVAYARGRQVASHVPPPSMQNRDTFEPLHGKFGHMNDPGIKMPLGDLSLKASVVLLKLRMLFCMKDIVNSSILAAKNLPEELLDLVKVDLSNSALVGNRAFMAVLRCGGSITPYKKYILTQIHEKYEEVHKSYPHFWEALLALCTGVALPTACACKGDKKLAMDASANVVETWTETPGAVKWLADKQGYFIGQRMSCLSDSNDWVRLELR